MNPFLSGVPVTPHRRTWGQRLVLGFNGVLILTSLTLAGLLAYINDKASAINRVALDRSLTEASTDSSGARVLNILLVGSDSSANLDPDDPIQIGRQGERLGDVIIIAHIDERTRNVAMLSLPRDLWVPIAGSEREDRINRAFLVGGPATLIDTIEETFDIPIHHYVNVDFAGFQGLVEAVDTVELYFETPARDWNVNASPEPRSQTGFIVEEAGCHSLDPDQALAYVRSRYYQTQHADGEWVTDPTSDLGRIRRQQDFLQHLLQKGIDVGARNPFVLGGLIDAAIDNVAIDQDLTPALLLDLGGTYRSFEPGDLQTYTYPALDGTVGANRVLIPRHEAAEPVIQLFRGESFGSPNTVGIELVYDETTVGTATGPTRPPASVEAIVQALDAEGFNLDARPPETLGPGLWVRHGPDGGQAAAIVAAALESAAGRAPTLVEVRSLVGRNVVVAIGTSGVGPGEDGEPAIQGPVDELFDGETTHRTEVASAAPAAAPVEELVSSTGTSASCG